ncbi:helix-turn-helix domain-containing protein [Streptomyces sp. NPDC054796]
MPALREIDPGESIEAFIGSRIRDARMERRWKQTELGQKVFASGSLISEIERGNEVPTRDLAKRLGAVLGLGNDLVNLLRLLSESQIRDYAREFLRKQLEATAMHEWSQGVPGLLQTEEYARAVMLAGQAGSPTQVDSYVQDRMERQARVWERAEPPWLWAVVDESVLHRDMGSSVIRHGQLQHLLAMGEHPNVTVRVLPFTAPQVAGYVSLLTLPDGSRLGYTEGHATGRVTSEPAEVQTMQRVYDRLAADALSAVDSRDAIMKRMPK